LRALDAYSDSLLFGLHSTVLVLGLEIITASGEVSARSPIDVLSLSSTASCGSFSHQIGTGQFAR
jgi:hypothetical protein